MSAGLRKRLETLHPELAQAPDAFLEGFARDVDESPHSLEEWAEAHARFARWEQEHGRRLTLEQKQEYLNCCIAGTNASAPLSPLRDVLEHFLETYGVTG